MKQLGRRWHTESQLENERMAIFINAVSNPIVLSLAGMKLKRRDLAWQFAVWCFALAVGILKNVVANTFV